MIRVSNIKIKLDTSEDRFLDIVLKKTGINKNIVKSFKISKKSIDARDKSDVHFVCSFDLELNADEKKVVNNSRYKNIIFKEKEEAGIFEKKELKGQRPIVVGSGPAGLFAALALSEMGLKPIILERGKCVEERKKDVENFWKTGKLNISSNVQFGEGGAGTFSDGKLTTGIKDKNCQRILEEFVSAGAPEEILYSAKPHIGTDKLYYVVQNIRKKIIANGGEFRFENKLENIIIENGKISSIKVKCADEESYFMTADKLILAIGHSARDTFEMLYKNNVEIIQKPFSVGARIEHKQDMINISQYGQFAEKKVLGAADYKMAVHLPSGRSVYTFCMCPGGTVVAAASEEGHLAVNGMSEYARDRENSNSALLVGISPEDFGGNHPLQGMYLQREIEKAAFEAGGGDYSAPVQTVGDFLEDRASTELGNVKPSYLPKYRLTNLSECLPNFVIQAMKDGIIEMDKSLKGFANPNAVLTGVETRSSSPIRILRNEKCMSKIKGLYPCGEGAGYAGGIMSAAADGIKCAQALAENM